VGWNMQETEHTCDSGTYLSRLRDNISIRKRAL
jgi:hypothetical protein